MHFIIYYGIKVCRSKSIAKIGILPVVCSPHLSGFMQIKIPTFDDGAFGEDALPLSHRIAEEGHSPSAYRKTICRFDLT